MSFVIRPQTLKLVLSAPDYLTQEGVLVKARGIAKYNFDAQALKR